jgi:two-component system CheB/CheR fusion protein
MAPKPYLFAIAFVLLAWGAQSLIGPQFGEVFALAPFLVAVMSAAWVGGLGPTLLAMAAGYLIAALTYMSPGSIIVQGKDNLAALAVYLLLGLSSGLLAELLHRARRTAEATSERLRVALLSMQESEQRFRQLAENIKKVFWMSDPQKDQVLYVSPAYEEIWGRSCASLYEHPRSFFDAIHPDDQKRVWTTSIERQKLGEATEVDYRVIRPDGEVRWVRDWSFPIRNVAGELYRLVGFAEDITDSRRTTERVSESEERLRLALDAGSMGVWDWDVQSNKLSWTERVYEIHGVAPDDFHGRVEDFTRLLHPEDAKRVSTAIDEALAGTATYNIEFRIVRPSGETRWIYTSGRVIRDDTGRAVRMLGATIDTTDRKKAEETLKEAHRQKDDFLAMLAHELRNPLAAIEYAMQLSNVCPDQSAGAMEIIERQVGHLAHLIDDLLDVSRITRDRIKLQRERLDARVIVGRAVATSQPAIESGRHRLSVVLHEAPLPVYADPTRVEQILVNLLTNAAKYTPAGGEISVRAYVDNEQLAIKVKDTGIGIPVEMLSRVFDLFTQVNPGLERSQGGLGIGLTVVRRLAELHGGSVSAASEGLGKGSEFTVRLPLLQGPLEHRESSEPAGELSPGLRVLVVEDNVDAASSLSQLLQRVGCTTQVAHDGSAALRAALEFRPDVVLLDIGLPGIDGYGVARRLCESPELGAIRLIAISGYGQEQDRERSRQAGFDHHLVKPVSFKSILPLLIACQPASEKLAAKPS